MMAATNAAHRMVQEARDALVQLGSPAADVLTVQLGEHLDNPARTCLLMPVRGRVTLGRSEVRRLDTNLWELRDPDVFGSVMVGRSDPLDPYRAGDWRVTRFGEEPPILLGETRQVEAALWLALDAFITNEVTEETQ